MKNLDYISWKVKSDLHGGPDSELDFLFEDVVLQGPLSLLVPLPADQSFPFDFLIPFLVNMKTRSNGLINLKMFQLG